MSRKSGREFVVESTSNVVDGVTEVVEGHGRLAEDEGMVDVLSDCLTDCHLSVFLHLIGGWEVVVRKLEVVVEVNVSRLSLS